MGLHHCTIPDMPPQTLPCSSGNFFLFLKNKLDQLALNIMKVILLIPPTSLEVSYGGLYRFSNPQPSIGLAYIGALIESNGYEVKIVDAYVNQYSLQEILDKIENSDVLGISSLSSTADVTSKICAAVKDRFPDCVIVHGNIHPSLFPEECLGEKKGDYIVHNEGEITFLELCDFLSGRKNLEITHIKGLSFRRDNKIVTNTPRPFLDDLDLLPFPAWHLYDLKKYKTDPRTQVLPNANELQILGTRGCPMDCTFCSGSSKSSQGHRYRMRSPKNIVDEMRFYSENLKTKVFNFMDLSFPLVKKHAMEFCQLLIDSELNKNIRWVCELRVKPLDRELISLMKKSGCVRVCFGIESGNDFILKSIKKGFTRDDVLKAVHLCKEEGLEVDGMFMLGLPGESEKTLNDTVQFAIDLDLRFSIFNLFVPYPGCQLFDELNSMNKIHFSSLSDFISYPTYSGKDPVYVPDGLTKNDLMRVQSEAMRRFYLRPRFIWRQIKNFRLEHLAHYFSGLKEILFT